ncbi:hypothetical protein Hdeb2414_s0026g00676251 [Helianthus debilis subsp. tardiflorus]
MPFFLKIQSGTHWYDDHKAEYQLYDNSFIDPFPITPRIFMAFDNYLQFQYDLTPPSDVSVAKKVFKENSNVNGHWLIILEGCHIHSVSSLGERIYQDPPRSDHFVWLSATSSAKTEKQTSVSLVVHKQSVFTTKFPFISTLVMLTYFSLIGIFTVFDNSLRFLYDLTHQSDVSVAKKSLKKILMSGGRIYHLLSRSDHFLVVAFDDTTWSKYLLHFV